MSESKPAGSTPPTEAIEKKVGDSHLRELALGRIEGKATAIVELNLPQRRIAVAPTKGGDARSLRPTKVIVSPTDEKTAEDTIAGARDFLQKLLGEEPRRLKAARAFVVEADGAALRAIAEQEFCRRIEPNRRRGWKP